MIWEAKDKLLRVRFLGNFTHFMAVLLWVGGIVAFIGLLPQIDIAIRMVSLINGAFSFWKEFKAEKATEALRKLLPAYVRVLRERGRAARLSGGAGSRRYDEALETAERAVFIRSC